MLYLCLSDLTRILLFGTLSHPICIVHQTVIHAEGFRSLAEGEPVEFSLHEDRK